MMAIFIALFVGFAIGRIYSEATIRRLRRRVKQLRAELAAVSEGRPTKPETMKRVVWACIINGFAWVWCSYILAALDKPQIAEELSKVALAEIIAPVVVYAGKSLVENLSKNNRWPDSPEPGGIDTPEPQTMEPQAEQTPDTGL